MINSLVGTVGGPFFSFAFAFDRVLEAIAYVQTSFGPSLCLALEAFLSFDVNVPDFDRCPVWGARSRGLGSVWCKQATPCFAPDSMPEVDGV